MRIQVTSRVIDAHFVDKPRHARPSDNRHVVVPIFEDQRPSSSTEYARPSSSSEFATYGFTGKAKCYGQYENSKSGMLLDMTI